MSEKFNAVKDIYPCTIIKDRYNGTYSGGPWLAFNLYPEDIPKEIGAGDTEEMNYFWREFLPVVIGLGLTPNAALEDLIAKTTKPKGV